LDGINDIAPNEFDIRPQLLSYDPNWGAYAGRAIPDPFVAYIYYRHAFDESEEGDDGRMVPPLERIDPQHGSTVAANFAVRYTVEAGEGTVGANPWQSPSDGMNVDVWIANEADARSEVFWRLGCYTQNQKLWVYGLKEVWGASKQSYRAYYWEIQNGLDPLNPYCESKGSITLVDENGQELQYLPESTAATPHYFYVKMTSPINRATLPPSRVTANIDGKLISYDAEGNRLEEKTIPLVSQSNGFHLSGKIEAIYGPDDPPSVKDAATINTIKGAPVVFTGGGGAGTKAVPTYMAVRILSINFNGLPLRKNLQDMVLVPEYVYDSSIIEPAAYVRGTIPSITAEVKVIPPEKGAFIRPISAKCGRGSPMPSCLMNFPTMEVRGDYTEVNFSASPLPAVVFSTEDFLWWQVIPEGADTIKAFPVLTGPHEIFVTYNLPIRSSEGCFFYKNVGVADPEEGRIRNKKDLKA